MIINNRTEDLNLVFKLRVEEFDYVIFVTSNNTKCFSCGKEGHQATVCPQRYKTADTQEKQEGTLGVQQEGQEGQEGTSGVQQESQVSLISLDQEKAFDWVEHLYLWRTLEGFGLSPCLIAMIKVLYQDIESVLKINGGLSAPFKVHRGVRQGCSLSGMLYALSIEPMLNKIRANIEGLILNDCLKSHILSAYADDIIVIAKNHFFREIIKLDSRRSQTVHLQQQTKQSRGQEALPVFISLLKARVWVDFRFFKEMKNMDYVLHIMFCDWRCSNI